MSAKAAEFNSEELAQLHRVARALLSDREYGELLADLLDTTIEDLRADRGFVVVRAEYPNAFLKPCRVWRERALKAGVRSQESVDGTE